ncbi:hypothetical protein FC15_GL000224 [Lapidilactobacillus concavus DSM 17758]|uniref:Uncharacterized protein n=1 Tax=Lapidilactobacillus concavus DSM 17758 TaxID=1423735 RepID=A0A0R1VTU8_9LACO|nr:hypothetical protein [Lapidilactobacillus concavus]KRM08847.1 hypothetical protein FC15_GL000224 [Lapidilactobacillus concavus DSM 17758]GEL13447.1 hypothetical protein LCO01nite_09960 [Lapidilactobacillus concavus]
MLDERLIGATFVNSSQLNSGVVEQYGVYYHYVIEGPAEVGDLLEVVRVTPLALIARRFDYRLTY